MKKILLDTNFIMACYQFKVDVFSKIDKMPFRYELAVLDRVVKELEDIAGKQKGKNREAAKIGLQLLKIKKVRAIKTESRKSTDDLIVDCASRGFLIATQDKDLKRRLITQGLSVIVLRQKKVLITKGFV